jgi:hypothetical protein
LPASKRARPEPSDAVKVGEAMDREGNNARRPSLVDSSAHSLVRATLAIGFDTAAFGATFRGELESELRDARAAIDDRRLEGRQRARMSCIRSHQSTDSTTERR